MSRPRATALARWTGLALLSLAPTVRAADEAVRLAIEREDYTSAAALLRDRLERAPDDETAQFGLARVLAWSGDYAQAIAIYETLVAQHPDNVDYAFGHAQALLWSGSENAALEELERARRLAPDYEAVWRLEFALLRQRGANEQARLEALGPEAERRFPQGDWWSPVGTAAGTTELTVSRVVQSLSNGTPDWHTTLIRVSREKPSGAGFSGSMQREQRFGASDTAAGFEARFSATPVWTTGLDLEFSPDADFMAQTTIAGWASRPVSSAWETVIRARHRRYDSAEVTSGAATAARYVGDFRAAYTLNLARLNGDATSLAHVVTLNYYRSEALELDLTLSRGEEAEAVSPGAVLQTDIRAVTLGARHRLGGNWRLEWWLGTQRQGELYRRKYVGVSIAAGL